MCWTTIIQTHNSDMNHLNTHCVFICLVWSWVSSVNQVWYDRLLSACVPFFSVSLFFLGDYLTGQQTFHWHLVVIFLSFFFLSFSLSLALTCAIFAERHSLGLQLLANKEQPSERPQTASIRCTKMHEWSFKITHATCRRERIACTFCVLDPGSKEQG